MTTKRIMVDRIMSIIMFIVIAMGGLPILVILADTGGPFWFLLGLLIFGAMEAAMVLAFRDSIRPEKEDG